MDSALWYIDSIAEALCFTIYVVCFFILCGFYFARTRVSD